MTLTRPDAYRVEARDPDGRLLAYAVCDAYGWAVLVRRGRRIRAAWRVDYGSTAARDVRVVDRLHRAARGVTA